ncbi:Respiratory supercomplex factor 1, mitochondrial [Trapelia coarctata]|nr:Respiratory supercomplex factor 1, mitochondrial [Trapelia coarctata]
MSGAPLPSSFDENTEFYEENRWQKFSRRLKEEPLIPLGCALTCWALYGATRSIRRGDHATTNRMFRARIYAQGFTLLCLVAGSYYYAEDREKRKVFDGVKSEQRAREKNEKWIRELEARDREDQEEKQAKMRRLEGRLAKVGKETKEASVEGRLAKVGKETKEASVEGRLAKVGKETKEALGEGRLVKGGKETKEASVEGKLVRGGKETKKGSMEMPVGAAKSALERSEEKWKGGVLEAAMELWWK